MLYYEIISKSENMNYYKAWTDGSADNLNPLRPGGAAYIIVDSKGRELRKASKGFWNTTSNRMELLAIISVVNCLPSGSSVIIHTDSQYCMKAVKMKHPEKNEDLLSLYHKIVDSKQLEVSFKWVKGHAGNKRNEKCDKMAKEEYLKMVRKCEEDFPSHITTKGQRKQFKRKKG